MIVGPVGGETASYRAEGDLAAAAAAKYTPNVVKIYSPNATWAAVKPALQGASFVIYFGHGNGFPSPYTSVLAPDRQNGLGLNPVAGKDDSTTQYWGEKYIVERRAPRGQRGGAAGTPVLRLRQLGAGQARSDARHGEAARRQLRRGLPRRGSRGGLRRRARQGGRAVRRGHLLDAPVDRRDLGRGPGSPGQRVLLPQRPNSRQDRVHGSRRDVRQVLPLRCCRPRPPGRHDRRECRDGFARRRNRRNRWTAPAVARRWHRAVDPCPEPVARAGDSHPAAPGGRLDQPGDPGDPGEGVLGARSGDRDDQDRRRVRRPRAPAHRVHRQAAGRAREWHVRAPRGARRDGSQWRCGVRHRHVRRQAERLHGLDLAQAQGGRGSHPVESLGPNELLAERRRPPGHPVPLREDLDRCLVAGGHLRVERQPHRQHAGHRDRGRRDVGRHPRRRTAARRDLHVARHRDRSVGRPAPLEDGDRGARHRCARARRRSRDQLGQRGAGHVPEPPTTGSGRSSSPRPRRLPLRSAPPPEPRSATSASRPRRAPRT